MQHAERQALTRKFGLLQMAFWCYIGAFISFLITMMYARGFDARQVAIFIVCQTLASVLGQLVFGRLADHFQRNRLIFLLLAPALLATCYLLYFVEGFGLTCVCFFAAGLVKDPMSAMMDSWQIKSFHGDMSKFGNIRSMGSITYACLMLMLGFVMDAWGFVTIPVLSTAFCVVVMVVAFTLPEVPRIEKEQTDKKDKKHHKVRLSPVFYIYFGTLLVLGLSVIPVYNMMPRFLFALGGTATQQGIALFLNAGMEFPAMRAYKLIAKFEPPKRLFGCLILYIGSTLMMAFATHYIWILIGMGISGAAFGTQLVARREMVNLYAPPHMQTTLHSIGDMIYGGLGGMMGNYAAGYLLDTAGAKTMLVCASAAQGVVMLLVLVMLFYMKKEKNQKAR